MAEFLQTQGLVGQTISDDEPEQFWRTHLESWAPSGLSQAEYCRRNDLNISRFRYRKRKFDKKDFSLEFIQLPTTTEPVKSNRLFQHTATPSLRITMGSEFTIEVLDDFSPVTLEEVLLTLKGM